MHRLRSVPDRRSERVTHRDVAAGSRFRDEVDQARQEAGFETWTEMFRASGVGESTWRKWFQGRSKPSATMLELAVRPIPRTPQQLLDTWEGQPPRRRRRAPATPLDAAAVSVVEAIDRQTAMLERMLERMAPIEVRLDEAAEEAREWAEEQRDRRVADRRRPVHHRTDGEER